MPEGTAKTDAAKPDPRLASRNLVADFPEMLSEADAALNIHCPNGWYSHVWECLSAIYGLAPDTKISCVKEKFGGLRIYVDSPSSSEIDDLIEQATYLCDETCQQCSEPGQLLRRGHVMATLCEACYRG